jgi:hypothetical protein
MRSALSIASEEGMQCMSGTHSAETWLLLVTDGVKFDTGMEKRFSAGTDRTQAWSKITRPSGSRHFQGQSLLVSRSRNATGCTMMNLVSSSQEPF